MLTFLLLAAGPVWGTVSPLSPRPERPELYSEAFTTVFDSADYGDSGFGLRPVRSGR